MEQEPLSPADLERVVVGLVEVVRLLQPSIGLTNSILARVVLGEATPEDGAALDAVNLNVELAETLLGRLAEFVSPDALEAFRRGGGL